MGIRTSIAAILLLIPAMAAGKGGIVDDFIPVCDSMSVLVSEKTGVHGELKLKNVMKRSGRLDFYFDESLSDFPWREDSYSWFRAELKSLFPEEYSRYRLGEIYCKRDKASRLPVKPPGYDGNPVQTPYRRQDPKGRINPLVVSTDREWFSKGMSGRHLAIWPSHGRYFSQTLGRWTWQRPQLFTTVEDMMSTGFVLQYLVPMLENSGAYVMLPRERDTSPIEIIIDNDPCCTSRNLGRYEEHGDWEDAGQGFADTTEILTRTENPFMAGTARMASCSKESGASVLWIPDIPERGEYAVYISYRSLPNSTSSALYKVHHLGGESSFAVNQKIGGGTWIYLGTFEFDKGTGGYVELSCSVPEGRKFIRGTYVCADAVKIGGGMGNIARSAPDDSLSAPATSGLPRYAEAARYWLQWAGMDTTIFCQHRLEDDYRDDLFSRGDWVGFMSGGSSSNPGKPGRGIPFDLTFAFHSDAGVTPCDSTIGTLVIYTRTNERENRLPDGEDRLTGREFADIVQSQVVHDIRSCIDSSWTRRQIWDRAYRESRTPPTPTILLESFSHQNFADMRLALDPSFRFILSRAIYKGMLKYLSNRYGCAYAVQPLPVRAFSAMLTDSLAVDLSWLPRTDDIEPTAVPSRYKVYTRTDDGAFDSGQVVETMTDSSGRVHAVLPMAEGHIYSFRVTALNDGGESFPSETLAAGIPYGKSSIDSTVLVVNNFTRTSAPVWYDTPEIAGFDSSSDPGMPYISDISYVGEMYEPRRSRQWTSDANPGFGASFGQWSGRPSTGNSFDYVYIHGKAIFAAGYPFCSTSSETFSEYVDISPSEFIATDIICGEQVTTVSGRNGQPDRHMVFPENLQSAIRRYTSYGGNVMISGSHIGTDIWDAMYPVRIDSSFRASSIEFAEDVLGFTWVRGHASKNCSVQFLPQRDTLGFNAGDGTFSVNTEYAKPVYRVVSPDGIAPSSDSGRIISEYTDSRIPSGISYTSPSGYRTTCFGFPVEALASEEEIFRIISSTLKFFRQ